MLSIRKFNELSSTNDYALELLNKRDINEDTLILSDIQSAGRGRQNGRLWKSVNGNFHGTYTIDIEKLTIKNYDVLLLNYATSLAIQDVLNSISKKENIQKEIILKSPNDILIGEKKIAGVLIEISHPYAAIGIGVN